MEPLNNKPPPSTNTATATATPAAKPKLKRGRPIDPLRPPRGYRKRLMEEIQADMIAEMAARKAAPGYAERPRFSFRPRHPAHMPPPSTGKRKSGAEYRRLREEKAAKTAEEAKRKAALLAWVTERKLERQAAEKRAAERKAKGVKLSFGEWKREVMSEWCRNIEGAGVDGLDD
jgi:hypothetical protein